MREQERERKREIEVVRVILAIPAFLSARGEKQREENGEKRKETVLLGAEVPAGSDGKGMREKEKERGGEGVRVAVADSRPRAII